MTEVWKSPRKVEEEIRQYQRTRFETIMAQVDAGEITHQDAMTKIAMENVVEDWVDNAGV